MKSLHCDVCQKDITTAISQRTYFHLANREVCENCHDQLQATLKPVVRAKQPFNYEWYDRLVRDSVEKAVSRGKWETK